MIALGASKVMIAGYDLPCATAANGKRDAACGPLNGPLEQAAQM
jgi:hypothetical protein